MNGWSNYETWNVSLWAQNDEGWYNAVRRYDRWDRARLSLEFHGITQTPDGVSIRHPDLDISELDAMCAEL